MVLPISQGTHLIAVIKLHPVVGWIELYTSMLKVIKSRNFSEISKEARLAITRKNHSVANQITGTFWFSSGKHLCQLLSQTRCYDFIRVNIKYPVKAALRLSKASLWSEPFPRVVNHLCAMRFCNGHSVISGT
ncbi:hypothetical protein PsAD26_01172 [Pseudovibrio sp. Ad26]|nr:hypothetical protein PsAD26_01172 [Pseudovibrio sp. Ad26]